MERARVVSDFPGQARGNVPRRGVRSSLKGSRDEDQVAQVASVPGLCTPSDWDAHRVVLRRCHILDRTVRASRTVEVWTCCGSAKPPLARELVDKRDKGWRVVGEQWDNGLERELLAPTRHLNFDSPAA